jgi:hypothetical protein
MDKHIIKELKEIWDSRNIDLKKKSYLLYENEWLGNKALTWNSLSEIQKSGWKDCICIRSGKGIAR